MGILCDIKRYKVGFLISIFLWLSACTTTTTGLWEKHQYTETVSHFFISADGTAVVLIGEDYHYIFQDADSLVNILSWTERHKLRGEFPSAFKLENDQQVSGSFSIICDCTDVDSAQIEWLKAHHFISPETGSTEEKQGKYRFEGTLAGTRYQAGGLDLSRYTALNRPYEIDVWSYRNSNTMRALFTPIAVAEDGIATLFAAPLMVLALPFVILDALPGGE